MKSLLSLTALTFSAALLLPSGTGMAQESGAAQEVPALSVPEEVAPAEAEDSLDAIEAYLNDIESLQGRFVQTTSRGGRSEGDFALRRPGRIRFDYDAPEPTLLVADGMNFVIYDRELEQATMVPLSRTPLWLLLREDIDLEDGLDILNVQQDEDYLSILLRQSDSPEEGTIELVFQHEPLELVLWEVVDTQGVRTQVALHELDYETRPNPSVFNVQNLPGIRAPGFDRTN